MNDAGGVQTPPPASPSGATGRPLIVHDSLRREHRSAVNDLFGRLLRSAGARFAVIYAGLFVASALALAVFLWWSTAGLLARQTDAAINADSRGLEERYAGGGLAALKNTIDQRLAVNVDDDAIYLLVDPAFRPIAGNLERWPPQVTMDDEWAELPISRAGIRGIARVHQFDLPGGFHLLVGRDVESRVQMRNLLGDALLWAGMIALALGTFGAWAVRRIFAVTLANVSETAAAVAAGDFGRRVRRSGNGDEFDKIADTINEMLDTIGRLMDGVREVSNAIAHDLRTPIARARARLEEAATHARSEADLRAALERAVADLDALTAIFEALLRIAEIEAGNRRAAFADVDLAPLLLDMTDLYGAVAEERGIALETDVPPAIPVWGDRDMLQQALANLIDNALKFAPADSTVRVGATTGPDSVTLWIADSGPGIPDADRAHATDRFFRGESARSTPGSGLGLALVQAVTTLHGGRLELGDNAPGLRATITLRRWAANAVAHPVAAAQHASA